MSNIPLKYFLIDKRTVAVPTTIKLLRSFVGVINYYRDMWKLRSDILTPLTKMTSKQATWNWTEEHQKAFEHILTLINCLKFTWISAMYNLGQ